MRISSKWLRELVDLPWSDNELPEKLAGLGFPVEKVERTGVQATGVIAVRILTVDKHPNADRLRIAKVTDGKQERTIVCGAPNIAPEQTVPLATPGAKLPGGLEIVVSKIRGVESGGMLCSERELGLSEEHAGILQLPAGTALGADVADVLGGGDTVFEIEVTPNRPDVLSHVGIARDLAALAKAPLKLPAFDFAPGSGSVDIEIAEPQLCHRYLGAVIRGVKIGPAPKWMADRLKSCGIRSINNVVDITNYVLLEWGHPLHAFDLAKVKGPAIRVRRAAAGEKIVALDERTYELTANDLVIADKAAPSAIAGIMGGQGSGVTDATVDVLLESAVFDRAAIRTTAKRLALRSESSIRFEKGTDAETAERAWKRAAKLILELAGGSPAGAKDVFPTKPVPAVVHLRKSRLSALLGMAIPDATVKDILDRLGFQPKEDRDGWACAVPAFRKDVTSDADLIEEVVRVVGYNAVPASISKITVGRVDDAFKPIDTAAAAAALRGWGFTETLTPSFCPSDWPEKFGVPAQNAVALANPISQEESILRPTLAINLVRAAVRNLNHQRRSVFLFETGKTFDGAEAPKLGLMACGVVSEKTWQAPERLVDVYYLKGALSSLAGATRAPFSLEPGAKRPFLHPYQSFTVRFRGKDAGWAGMLDPRLAGSLDLGVPCALAEIDLEVFRGAKQPLAAPLARFPFVERDIAVVVDRATPWAALRSEAEKAAGDLLKDVHPFDVFSGGSLEAGQKSIAFRVRLQDPSKTLSETDITAAVDRIKSSLQKNCGAKLR